MLLAPLATMDLLSGFFSVLFVVVFFFLLFALFWKMMMLLLLELFLFISLFFDPVEELRIWGGGRVEVLPVPGGGGLGGGVGVGGVDGGVAGELDGRRRRRMIGFAARTRSSGGSGVG